LNRFAGVIEAACVPAQARLLRGGSWSLSPTDRVSEANDNSWITADARIDAHAELQRQLEAAGRAGVKAATDAELILHAYHAWGDECVQHLLGDFAIGIWDGPRRRLFCARDHFGVRPFYYARAGQTLVFSSRLEDVHQHPDVSPRLNERAIADFLAFGFKQDHSETAFADIHSLPPAHSLVCEGGEVRVQRYWTLPVEPVRFRRPEEYRERYFELLEAAVADRLRTSPAAILLSGGIDSPSVAADARKALPSSGDPSSLQAYTVVYDRLIDHDERHWAGLVAGHLGIPIEYVPADDCRLYEGWDEADLRTPEPQENPLWAVPARLFRRIAANGYDVVLTGEAGDAVSVPERALPELLATGNIAALARDLWHYWRSHGERPPFWVRAWWESRAEGRRGEPQALGLPAWLHPHVAADVRERAGGRAPTGGGGWAHRELQSPMWPWVALTQSPEWTKTDIEVYYPFLDLRLVSFMLSVPSVPWMHDKELMRSAMRGRLPEEVLRRPKVPLRQDPVEALFRRDGPPPLPDRKSPVWEFVDRAVFEREWNAGARPRELTRVLSLARWLAR